MNEDLDIRTMSLTEAWQLFLTMEYPDSLYQKIRWGVMIRFDIYEHLHATILSKNKVGLVYIQGKSYNASDFHSELELRNKALKDWLLEHYSPKQLFQARGADQYGIN